MVSCVDIKKVCGAMEGRERITVTEEGGLVRITASGISNHAAFPEGSVNAVSVLAQALSSSGVLERGTLAAAEGIAQMTADYYGAGCQIPFEDKESGSLTCVGSLVSTKDGIITVSFDIRYPVTVKGEAVLKDFEKAANGYGFTLKSSELSAPAYVSPNHPYIPVLCGICEYVQEKHYEPYTMGGGTYSRHLPLAVGFGPGIPDAPNPFEAGHGQGHQPDECIKEEILLKGLKTYIIALIELDKIL